MNNLFIKHFFVGFMVSEIPRVSVFGYFPLYLLSFLIDKVINRKYLHRESMIYFCNFSDFYLININVN